MLLHKRSCSWRSLKWSRWCVWPALFNLVLLTVFEIRICSKLFVSAGTYFFCRNIWTCHGKVCTDHFISTVYWNYFFQKLVVRLGPSIADCTTRSLQGPQCSLDGLFCNFLLLFFKDVFLNNLLWNWPNRELIELYGAQSCLDGLFASKEMTGNWKLGELFLLVESFFPVTSCRFDSIWGASTTSNLEAATSAP